MQLLALSDDGTDFATISAQIAGTVDDASPAANSVGGALKFYTAAGAATNDLTERMRIQNDGKLLIGYGPGQESDATALLTVSGDVSITGELFVSNRTGFSVKANGDVRGFKIDNDGIAWKNMNVSSEASCMSVGADNKDVTILEFGHNDGGTAGYSDPTYGFAIKYMGARADKNNSFSIFADQQTTARKEVFTIDQDGKVAIGGVEGLEVKAEALLQVSGDVSITGELRVQGGAYVAATDQDVLIGDDIQMSSATNWTKVVVGQSDNNSEIVMGQDATHNMVLRWDYDSTPADAHLDLATYGGNNPLVLQQWGGNVGVGTKNPGESLHVSGNALIKRDLGANANAYIHIIGSEQSNRGAYIRGSRDSVVETTWAIGHYASLYAAALGSAGEDDLTFYTHADNDYRFYGGTNTAIFDGNVGIGTAIARAKLTVNGDAGITGVVKIGGDLMVGNTVLNPVNGHSDQVGLGFDESAGELQVASAVGSIPLQLGRITAAGDGDMISLRCASNYFGGISFDSNGGNYGHLDIEATGHALIQADGGNVGIGTSNPTNILQVGDASGPSYVGNHIAFGNGTHACGLFQGPNFTNMYSSIGYKFYVDGVACTSTNLATLSPRYWLKALKAHYSAWKIP